MQAGFDVWSAYGNRMVRWNPALRNRKPLIQIGFDLFDETCASH